MLIGLCQNCFPPRFSKSHKRKIREFHWIWPEFEDAMLARTQASVEQDINLWYLWLELTYSPEIYPLLSFSASSIHKQNSRSSLNDSFTRNHRGDHRCLSSSRLQSASSHAHCILLQTKTASSSTSIHTPRPEPAR